MRERGKRKQKKGGVKKDEPDGWLQWLCVTEPPQKWRSCAQQAACNSRRQEQTD